jgi:hypothetical protein
VGTGYNTNTVRILRVMPRVETRSGEVCRCVIVLWVVCKYVWRSRSSVPCSPRPRHICAMRHSLDRRGSA